jgi:hypothetical protein
MTANEWVIFFIGQLVTAAAIWGGIRADIRGMRDHIIRVEKSADKAHSRLDRFLELDKTGPPWYRSGDHVDKG